VLRNPPLRPYAIAWVPLAAVYAALFMASGRPATTAVRSALVTVLPFALLGLLVLRLPRRVPWHDERRAGFFAAQLGLTVAYALVGAAGVVAAWTLDSLLTTGRAGLRFDPMIVAWQAVMGGLIYLAIAGGAYAWQNAQRVREESARAAQADALRARAELAVLRSQLNPHFLFNTLHAALGLVRRDPALAERALERLGEVLHYGLRMHREALDQVTLANEWAFVRSYLEIESLRLEERLRLHLEADPGAMEELVPPFVLQPLVENAILHAVAPRKAGGRVAITARRHGDGLRLEVCDDGPGMPASPERSGNGLGLQLLRERLAMLYAGRANLSLQPADGGGLRATIDLPLDRPAGPERP
jgi:LytS/YehU family sensor histidine kinase